MRPRQGSQQFHLRPAPALPRRLYIETIAPVCTMPVHIPVADSHPEVREPCGFFGNLQRGFQPMLGLLAAFPLSLLVLILRERHRWCPVALRHQPVILKLGGQAQIRPAHPEVKGVPSLLQRRHRHRHHHLLPQLKSGEQNSRGHGRTRAWPFAPLPPK